MDSIQLSLNLPTNAIDPPNSNQQKMLARLSANRKFINEMAKKDPQLCRQFSRLLWQQAMQAGACGLTH